MKRFFSIVLAACCALTLSAQEVIPVSFMGEKPTIGDFAWAFVSAIDDDEEVDVDESANAFKQAWIRYRQGAAQPDGETLTVDQRNGFVLYESADDAHLLRIEMCYWNESDQKHKMVAYCVSSFLDGTYSAGQYDGIRFFRYDNAAKTMEPCYEPGFDIEYGTEDGAWISYALPRSGKDITVTSWLDGRTTQRILKWNGHGFSF